ncbi:MAG: hypothetical protein M1365_11965, partial [Actinobacteria bacterium]|nr:hypothetical protein [Actinomycetota bacterium]
KIRRLTAPVVINGETVEKDVSQVYYSIKEIEGFRRNLEKQGYQVVVSVCFDMPSSRKDSDENATDEQNEAAKQYKANRVKRLKDWDFENIQLAEQLLSDAGHNTYRIDGYEADDIIANLVDMYANNFDFTIIYTCNIRNYNLQSHEFSYNNPPL